MANGTFDVSPRMLPSPYTTTSTNPTAPSPRPEDPTSASYIPRVARMIPNSTTVHTIFIRRSLTPSLLDLMNFGSWNGQKMVEKLGSRWKLFWSTFTSRVTGLHYAQLPTNGDSTMMYPLFRPPRLRQPRFLFYHILTTTMYMLNNRMWPFPIRFGFSNPAGDAPLNIIHKVHPHLYIGHHGELRHHPHHRHQLVELSIPISLRPLHVIYTDKYHQKNLALWICRTPACNDSL